MKLTPLAERFVLHFGEMGSRWGVNRTVGQIYAVLYISGRPLNADELVETLDFSRSNIGIGIKELLAWRLVKLVHLPGDRRDYYETPKDVWEIFRVLIEERRRREIEPTLSLLREALMEAPDAEEDRIAQERMKQMYELIELTTGWLDDVQRLSPETVIGLMRLGAKVQKVLEFADRLKLTGGRETDKK